MHKDGNVKTKALAFSHVKLEGKRSCVFPCAVVFIVLDVACLCVCVCTHAHALSRPSAVGS